MAPTFTPHTHPRFSSDTARSRRRTAWLEPLRGEIRRLAATYRRAEPAGTQVTLAVLDGLGQARLQQLAQASSRSEDTVKKDLGLFIVLVLIDEHGPAAVETLRHDVNGKNSTRSRTAQWPNLTWVSRYTPHRVRATAAVEAGELEDAGGFRGGAYLQVNREERFFCFLVGHVLLAHRAARAAFVELVQGSHPDCALDPDDLQVFVEAAALRDFWNDLGDPVAYDEETARRRRAVVDGLLAHVGSDVSVDDHDLFWTSPARAKLWSPGRWSVAALKAAGLQELLPLKWAFNAKPDFLLVSPGGALLIEAKLESGIGRAEGYDQLQVQRLIAELLTALVPAFGGVPVALTTLGTSGDDGLSWADVFGALDVPGLDSFTRAGLVRATSAGR